MALSAPAFAQTTTAPPMATAPAMAPGLFDPVFQDHAVLQRGRPVPIWGRAAPGETVTVRLASWSVQARADASGRWTAHLPTLTQGGPYELTAEASGGSHQTLSDILVGDVWLCSGQSNMEFMVQQSTNFGTEIANSADQALRLLNVGRANLPTPGQTLPDGTVWAVAGPQSAARFSAACFFMGQQLRRTQDVPIGLIAASWGGSVIEDWLDEPSLRTAGDYDQSLSILSAYARDPSEGIAMWSGMADRWWAANDPAIKAAQPWSAADFDDSGWQAITPEGFWETAIPDMTVFDGIGWYRTTVTLTEAQARQAARIELGPVDDIDATFVNGRKIGNSQGWDTPRTYALPAGSLLAGANSIAISALDIAGGGGAWGPASEKRIVLADGTSIPLSQPWRFKVSAAINDVARPPMAPWIGGSGVTTLYNGMIDPLGPYAVTGFAWYQGEANTGDPEGYASLLPALMQNWRGRFGEGRPLPFLVVQLANFGPASSQPHPSAWARLREVQREVVAADPAAGLAVAIDIGDRYDIHPTNKQQVGRRLSLEARRLAYGDTTAARTPSPLTATRDGDRVRVRFDHAGPGLLTMGSGQAVGFELCTADDACRFTPGVVEGDTVVLQTAGAAASMVRFCWSESPVCNLYGQDDLPAVPFEMAIR
ncbi:9-O-acetylesterase [Brevundimonas sp. Leaf363]|nr:9-O-acetylesterase [Brevundimonas sp. Leaf363]